MAYYYGYGAPGTSLNGILNYLQEKHLAFYKSLECTKTFKNLNQHLMNIRIEQEPNKPASNDIHKNATYIQQKYKFSVVVNYFKKVTNE